MKRCGSCGLEKETSQFYKDRSVYDQLTRTCISCQREREAAYRKMPNKKAILRAKADRMKHKYPEKMKARQALRNAVKQGKVTKPLICDACNATGRIEGHHNDYSKHLEVDWLCNHCHKYRHGKLVDVELVARAKKYNS